MKGLHGSETGLDQVGEVFVQAGAGKNVGGGRVGAGHDVDACGLHFPNDFQVARNDFFAQSKVGIGTMFEPLVNSFLPNLAFALRNIFHARVVRQVGLWSHESKMNDDGEGGNLPSVVGDEGAKEGIGFFGGVGIEELALPGARACE